MLKSMRFAALVRIYWLAALATLAVWSTVGWRLGAGAVFTVVVLTVLETTFSADNAVVNSKVLTTLSPLWQKLFMTVGIIFAVFVVRFAMPIVMVMLTAHLGFEHVLNLATHHPHQYARELHRAAPLINAFGGTFLIMIGLSYFVDYQKHTHWFGFVERRLVRLGQLQHITTLVTLAMAFVLYVSVDPAYHGAVFIASVSAMALHIGLRLLNAVLGGNGSQAAGRAKTGWAAFGAFCYLQILDGSFSLDGVIGAFAITSSVLLIMAGLGAGAVWVRAMTVHLVRTRALAKYVFLEHGAHWAIVFLGGVMLLKLYHVELPDWLTGSLGLLFITAAILWSKRYTRQLPRGA